MPVAEWPTLEENDKSPALSSARMGSGLAERRPGPPVVVGLDWRRQRFLLEGHLEGGCQGPTAAGTQLLSGRSAWQGEGCPHSRCSGQMSCTEAPKPKLRAGGSASQVDGGRVAWDPSRPLCGLMGPLGLRSPEATGNSLAPSSGHMQAQQRTRVQWAGALLHLVWVFVFFGLLLKQHTRASVSGPSKDSNAICRSGGSVSLGQAADGGAGALGGLLGRGPAIGIRAGGG